MSGNPSTNENRTIVAVDLFAGAGGFSEGLRQAVADLGYDLRQTAINHWEPAVETHRRNHPDAHQYHSKVEQLHPPNVVRELIDDADGFTSTESGSGSGPGSGPATDGGLPDVDLLLAGPECTHFSNARGGKPVNEQKRMSPWHVLDWLEKLDVEAFVLENVKEIMQWGPVEDGQPTRDGTVFDAWINALNQLGYSVEWTVLNAADYGDPTSRERFFLAGSQQGTATFPDPTHSDDDPDLPDRRPAAEIIDWSDLGGSIWTRDLEDGRKTPPKNSTMQRIAEGIRRHSPAWLDPVADVLETLGREEIRHLRQERVVPAEYAHLVADAVDDPFLVALPDDRLALSTPHLLRQQDGAHPIDVAERPVPTIASRGGHALATVGARSLVMPKNGRYRGLHSNALYDPADQPFHTVTSDPRAKLVTPTLVRYSHGGAALEVSDPMPTIATERGGVFALSSPYLTPMYNGRPNQRPRTRAVDRPLMTVPASKPAPAGLASPAVYPFVDDYEGPAASIDAPLGTITSRDRFALAIPELWPWGIDVRYRMLQPRELKRAQGFPADYEITGTKADRTRQIGNAVPVHLAKALAKHMLTATDPDLATYGGGVRADPDAEIPDYEEVVSDD